jgi:hypothetical protein
MEVVILLLEMYQHIIFKCLTIHIDGARCSSPGDRTGPPLPVRPGAQGEISSSPCMWEDRDLSREHEAQAMYTGSGR